MTPLSTVLLQAPGVAQDSNGQLHVRGDHGNLQYRINGVVIPESIGGFGQTLDTHFADQIKVLTGALPAQYGYRTAGVVDIQTKGGETETGGELSLLGGSNQHREASLELEGTVGAFSYFLTGSMMRNSLGIANPTPQRSALHDETDQGKLFGHLTWIAGRNDRLSLMFSNSNANFQIPNQADQAAEYEVQGQAAKDSALLDSRQNERTDFQVLTYQHNAGNDLNIQASLFRRSTQVHYAPDQLGDLQFLGVASDVKRRNLATGLQIDGAWKVSAKHHVRSGLSVQQENVQVGNDAWVFSSDDGQTQNSTQPFNIVDNNTLTGKLFGIYLQDEWQATKDLIINYGARWDRADTVVNETQFSPRLGAVYQLNESTRVHLGYARYFTPPPTEKIDTTSVSKFQGTTNALPSDANTAVKSERSHYFDMGFEHELSKGLTVGVDAYYRSIRHLHDEGQFGKALIYSAFNLAEGRIYGIELSTAYRAKNWSAYANIALASAQGKGIESGQFNFDDEELDYIAKNWVHLDHDQSLSGAMGASYRINSDTNLSTNAAFGSGLRRGFANTEHLPFYVQWDVSGTHSFNVASLGPFEARLSLINLFDRVYQIRDGSGIGVGAPQYAPRRSLFVGLSKSF